MIGVRGSQLAVSAGRRSVRVTMASNVNISVNLRDMRLAKAGDRVEFEGWYPKGKAGAKMAMARRLTVTSETPLGKPMAPRGRETKRGKKPVEKKTIEKKSAEKKADQS